jgi:hypothetical protein
VGSWRGSPKLRKDCSEETWFLKHLIFIFSSSVHPCDKAESPCKNEGVCEKNVDEFVCKCTEDWIGDTCEIKGKTILF